jgi:quercetin dioxygenase-like cupin family protein
VKYPLLAIAIVMTGVAHAQEPVVVTPVMRTVVTATGQPIVLPPGNATVVVSTYDIGRGAMLPVHKHPFPRYAYVLSGTLQVTNNDTNQTQVYRVGEFIIEAIDQWHHATTLDDAPVKLLVIDQVPGDAGNTIIKK